MSKEEIVTTEEDVEIEYDYVALLEGSAEDRIRAIYEIERPSREALLAKKKVAVAELVALGITEESAKLLASLYEEE